MWESVIALVGAAATALTWWVQRRKQDPLQAQLKHQREQYHILLDKYARSIGRVKTLEKLVIKYKRELYEEMDGDELIASWNRGLWDDEGDGDPN